MHTDAVMPKVCGTCHRVLDIYEDRDSAASEYHHTPQDEAEWLLKNPHKPVPVDMPADYKEGRCDFCNKFGIAYRLPVKDFEIPEYQNQGSKGPWAACVRCALMIRKDDWLALTNQAVGRLVAAGIYQPEGARAMRQLYRAVRKNICGPLEKV